MLKHLAGYCYMEDDTEADGTIQNGQSLDGRELYALYERVCTRTTDSIAEIRSTHDGEAFIVHRKLSFEGIVKGLSIFILGYHSTEHIPILHIILSNLISPPL